MSSLPNPEPDQPQPDQPTVILYFSQDQAGHWLVQDNAKRLEGRFTSYTAAMSFAQAERQIYRAGVEMAAGRHSRQRYPLYLRRPMSALCRAPLEGRLL